MAIFAFVPCISIVFIPTFQHAVDVIDFGRSGMKGIDYFFIMVKEN